MPLGVVAYGSSENATPWLNWLEQWDIFFAYGQWLLIVKKIDIDKISNQNFADQGQCFFGQRFSDNLIYFNIGYGSVLE